MYTSRLTGILSSLRVGLHVLFALLLAIGSVRAWQASPHGWILTLSAALGVWYLLGTTWDHRFAMGRTTRDPGGLAYLWLAITCVLWAALLVASESFLWLLFPLVFVVTHVLGDGFLGISAVVVALLLGIGLPLLAVTDFQGLGITTNESTITGLGGAMSDAASSGTGVSVAAIIGPTIGVAFAVACRRTYRALSVEAAKQEALAESLRHTVSELQRTQSRALAAENRAGRLAERERLSREIHDTLAQGFNSIVLFSRVARKAVAAKDANAAIERLEVISEVAQKNLAIARVLVAQAHADDDPRNHGGDATREATLSALPASLEPPSPDTPHVRADRDADLPAALRALGSEVTRQYGLPVAVDCPTLAMPADAVLVLERVVRESLTNAARHSGADQARVTVSAWPGELSVDVHDNGRGFDPDHVPPGHYGLAGIRSRLEEVGGALSIDSSPAGTVVAARVPLLLPASDAEETAGSA